MKRELPDETERVGLYGLQDRLLNFINNRQSKSLKAYIKQKVRED